MILKTMFWIGVLFLVLSIATSGLGVSGDRMRANDYIEREVDPTGTERKSRLKWALLLFLISIVFLAPPIIIYFVKANT